MDYPNYLGVNYVEGKCYFSTEYGGVSVLNNDMEHIAAYQNSNSKSLAGKAPLNWITYKDSSGQLWVGGGPGLYKWNFDSELFETVDSSLAEWMIYHFHPGDSGVWLATNNGLCFVDLYEPEAHIFYNNKSRDKYYLPTAHVAHVYEDKEGVFWLATKGDGLIKWNPKTKTSEQFTKENIGLSHNVVYAVYEDDHNYLWLPTDKGLCRMHKETRAVTIF